MSGGVQGSPKTSLKAAITAAIGNVSGGASSSGIVDELKQVIVNDNSSGSGSGSGSAILQQESAGTDSSSSSSSNGSGNRNVRSDVSEGRLTICNVIFGDDNRTGGHSNNNSNSNGNSNGNGNSFSGIFYRIIRRVDRLLRRWLPGYKYLRGGSGSGSAELSSGTGGNAPEHVSCVDASNAAELQWINEQQQQELSEVRVQGSSSTMTGHRNKWLTNEYLSGGITRAEFSAHLENILQKRMHKDNKKQVLPRGQHQN